jgi:hypothetical protein
MATRCQRRYDRGWNDSRTRALLRNGPPADGAVLANSANVTPRWRGLSLSDVQAVMGHAYDVINGGLSQ